MALIDPIVGRTLLEELGFLLVPGAPLGRGRAYLIVGFRAVPTLDHFDPERIDYWTNVDGHGMAATVDWPTHVAEIQDFSWGLIRIVDRLGVSNEFVSFGGRVETNRVGDVKVVVFSSEAPIIARGGHSQEWEVGSMEIVGYLARLRAAADPRGPLERRLAELSPVTRYAAFVWDGIITATAAEQRAGWKRADRLVLLRERRRLQQESPADWAAGVELACELDGTVPPPASG